MGAGVRQAVERWPEAVRAQPPDTQRVAAALLPEMAADHGHPELGQFELHDAVSRMLLRIARHPLVLVFDDFHFADPASLALLRFLAAPPGLHLPRTAEAV